ACFGGLAPGAGVIGLLVADVAVDLQDPAVVVEHVVGDRTGVGVLGVGVAVHLDHAVGDGVGDLLLGGPGAAVEDQVERERPGTEAGVGAVLLDDRVLGLLQDLGAQLDVA